MAFVSRNRSTYLASFEGRGQSRGIGRGQSSFTQFGVGNEGFQSAKQNLWSLNAQTKSSFLIQKERIYACTISTQKFDCATEC